MREPGIDKVPVPAVWVPACCLGEAAVVPAFQGWVTAPPPPSSPAAALPLPFPPRRAEHAVVTLTDRRSVTLAQMRCTWPSCLMTSCPPASLPMCPPFDRGPPTKRGAEATAKDIFCYPRHPDRPEHWSSSSPSPLCSCPALPCGQPNATKATQRPTFACTWESTQST